MFSNALITGASSGIGAEFARQLAPQCKNLVLLARRKDRLERLRTKLLLQRSGIRIHIYEADLADEAQVDQFVEWLEGTGIELDLLINNAGLGDHGAFADGDWDRVRAMISVNVTALTKLNFRLLPHLRRRKRAAILNVSSVAGFLPLPNMAVYAATKAYVTSLSEALRAELRGTSVSVTALCPGPVETEFGKVAARDASDDQKAPDVMKVPVGQVVAQALRGVERDQARVIPGLLVAAIVLLIAALPMILLRVFLNKRR